MHQHNPDATPLNTVLSSQSEVVGKNDATSHGTTSPIGKALLPSAPHLAIYRSRATPPHACTLFLASAITVVMNVTKAVLVAPANSQYVQARPLYTFSAQMERQHRCWKAPCVLARYHGPLVHILTSRQGSRHIARGELPSCRAVLGMYLLGMYLLGMYLLGMYLLGMYLLVAVRCKIWLRGDVAVVVIGAGVSGGPAELGAVPSSAPANPLPLSVASHLISSHLLDLYMAHSKTNKRRAVRCRYCIPQIVKVQVILMGSGQTSTTLKNRPSSTTRTQLNLATPIAANAAPEAVAGH